MNRSCIKWVHSYMCKKRTWFMEWYPNTHSFIYFYLSVSFIQLGRASLNLPDFYSKLGDFNFSDRHARKAEVPPLQAKVWGVQADPTQLYVLLRLISCCNVSIHKSRSMYLFIICMLYQTNISHPLQYIIHQIYSPNLT